MFFSTVIYLELFVALFFLPGFFITVILGIKKFRFLLSFALSYSVLVLTLLPFEYYALPVSRWSAWIQWEWIILAVLAVAKTFMYRNFKGALFVVRSDRFVIPASLLRRSKALGYEGWKAGIQEKKLLDSSLHGNDRRERSGRSGERQCYRGPNLIRGLFNPRLIIPLALAGVICGYLAYAGPYLEMPSDAWTHVYRFQWHKLCIINNGVFPSGLSWNGLLLHNTSNCWHFNPWYFIHAWLCHISGLAVMASFRVLTFVNVLTFLLGFYYFGLFIFAGLRISVFKKMMMAAFASLFAAATMGNMVFAYIRYYAFAPAILNYVLFLAAMALIIAWLRSNCWFGCTRFDFAQCRHHRWLGHALWIAPILIIVTSVIHTQEVLFIFFMTLALSLVETIRVFWRKLFNLARHSRNQCVSRVCHSRAYSAEAKLLAAKAGSNRESRIRINSDTLDSRFRGNDIAEEIHANHWAAREWKSLLLFIVLALILLTGFVIIRYFKPASWISTNMIMPRVGIPSEPVNFIFQKLVINPPHNPWFRLAVYQLFIFYQVVGLWGLFVYLLFILTARQFVKLPYLIAGMVVVPLLTTFNPLMVDMMVRLGQDPTVYRFHYMIPLPFVGGYLFIHFWCKARKWFYKMRAAPKKSVSPIWPRLSWINFVGCLLVLVGLIGLVFPINAAGIYAPYSKIYTLRQITAGNDYHLWEDMGKIMEKYEKKIILMDYLSRFMAAYFPNNNCVCSTWLNSSNPETEQPEPYTWESLRGRGMIIVNRRDGAPSVTGRIARHWPEDVLKVSRYYSLEAQYYLESHPEKFRKIWAQNQIAVYAVR